MPNLLFLTLLKLLSKLFLESLLNLSGVINFSSPVLIPYLRLVLPYIFWGQLCLAKFQLIFLICLVTVLFRIGYSQGSSQRHGSKNLFTPAAGNLPSVSPLFVFINSILPLPMHLAMKICLMTSRIKILINVQL
jgi:hypothetical protein